MSDPFDTWWRDRQRDWQQLPRADVDWLVVWNVNLGGGRRAFSVRNRHWGDHPFMAGTVPRTRAWVWIADDVDAPDPWTNVDTFGGIPSLIALTARGVPLGSGTILVAGSDAVDDLVRLAATLDEEVATAGGGAWCPALVGEAGHPRFGISSQRSVGPTAVLRTVERLGIDDVVVVDPFGERGYATPVTPHILVRGRRDGTRRRARTGRERLADVPVPPKLEAVKRVGDIRHHDRTRDS